VFANIHPNIEIKQLNGNDRIENPTVEED